MTSPASKSSVCNVAVFGATGRMGREIIRVLDERSDAVLCGASAGDSHGRLGSSINRQVKLSHSADAIKTADAAIDFSLPEAAVANIDACVSAGVPYVSGVTGLDEAQTAHLEKAGSSIPVLWAPNMSVGVNLCFAAAAEIARGLHTDFDVSVLDIHHAGKRDTPSGTALEFGRAIENVSSPLKIRYDSIREGEHPGEHLLRFSQGEEVIELRHRAGSRREFANGAVRAACWLQDQAPGIYNMRNLLDITSSA